MTRNAWVSMFVLLAATGVRAAPADPFAPVEPAGETVVVVDTADIPVAVNHASVMPGPGQFVMIGLSMAGLLYRRHRSTRA